MKRNFFTGIERIRDHFRRHRKYLVWGILVTVLSNAIGMISPWIVKEAIDKLKQNQATNVDLWTYAVLIVALALASGVFLFFMRMTIIWASRLFELELRDDFFSHLLTLPRSFYQEIQTGDLIARGSNDIEAVRMLVGPGIMQILNSVVSMTVALVLMLALSWKLTLIALCALPILSVLTNRIGMRIYQQFYKIQDHFSLMTSFVQENVSGVKVVKAYNQENNQIGEFAKLNQTYINLNLALAKTRGIFLPSIYTIVGLIVLLLIYFGGCQVISGAISLGTLVAFVFYLLNLVWPMLAVGWVVSLYQRGTASLDRIEKIMQRKSEVADREPADPQPPLKGAIEIKNLSFSYPHDERLILKEINLKIPAGQTVALVGPTGCGKTTLVNLLLRTFQIPADKILIDNLDINKIPLEKLRSHIGYVTQETFLFSQSLRENIAFGSKEAKEPGIAEAAEIAGIREEIEEFPQGFETIIGERGVTLSGGQKQRVSLARAIIGQPPILILDDAFSSVDTNTEEIILTRLKQVLKSRTSIIISHRISTVKNADLIFVIDDGRIVASGTHEELLRQSPLYARMVELQSLERELEVLG